jgi:hypothetical protein
LIWDSEKGDELVELAVDAEPGPSMNKIRCTLRLLDKYNRLLAEAQFVGRQVITLVPCEKVTQTTVKLQVETDNLPVPGEKRFLNLRVFDVSVKMKKSAAAGIEHLVRERLPV